MTIRPVLGMLAALLLVFASPLRAQDGRQIAVDGREALQEILAGDATGAVLVLAPGEYGKIEPKPGRVPRAIVAADPARPAVVTGLKMSDFDGLLLENLVFDYRFHPDHPPHIRPFQMRDCSNLVVRGNRFVGDIAHSREDERTNGYAFGSGLQILACERVRVEGNHISQFYRGLIFGGLSDAVVAGNEITEMRMDGMNFSASQRVRIEGNYIHDFHRAPIAADHADMIQFWTRGTGRPSTDIVIRGNVLNSANGHATQTIFMRNEEVDQGKAGAEMFYRDILIEENVILNGHLHGITVGEADGLTIRHNTVLQNLAAVRRDDPAHPVRIPIINLKGASRDVTVERNIVPEVKGFNAQSDWRVAGNVPAQPRSRGRPYHFTTLFEGWAQGDPAELSSYRYKPDLRDVGARMLRR